MHQPQVMPCEYKGLGEARLTKEDKVDAVLVEQGLHLVLEALHLLIVGVVGVVAAGQDPNQLVQIKQATCM